MKKTDTKYILFLIGIVLSFFITRTMTLFILVMGIYGESDKGLKKANIAYEHFYIKHLPIILTTLLLTFLIYQSWKLDQNRTVGIYLILLLTSFISYVVLDKAEVLWQ